MDQLHQCVPYAARLHGCFADDPLLTAVWILAEQQFLIYAVIAFGLEWLRRHLDAASVAMNVRILLKYTALFVLFCGLQHGVRIANVWWGGQLGYWTEAVVGLFAVMSGVAMLSLLFPTLREVANRLEEP